VAEASTRVAEQGGQQPAVAAAEVEDAARARGLQYPQHRRCPQVTQGGAESRAGLRTAVPLGRAGLGGAAILIEQARGSLGHQPRLVAQVPAHDQVSLGMPGQPLSCPIHQLADLVLAHPVVFVVVQHRQQHIQLPEQVAHPARGGDPHVEIPAVTPRRERGVKRDGCRTDLVAKRLEHLSEQPFPAPAGQHRQVRRQLQAGLRQVGALGAAATQSRAEHLADRHRQQRGGGVGPVIDVGGERERAATAAAHQRDRVHFTQQRSGAAARLRRRVEDVCCPPAH
jgi:hypothetical protein